ncbi:hypothetical protein B0O80DRAFT_494733 [Mortierella sp. GBAus27b]|nr:hypothetical protein BGX31_004970 [Mortierella sp. GBA43]KAI8360578.1 hypothetical protein B0O80DRAFT_494733 [Mortierella sp. GBAus27b]
MAPELATASSTGDLSPGVGNLPCALSQSDGLSLVPGSPQGSTVTATPGQVSPIPPTRTTQVPNTESVTLKPYTSIMPETDIFPVMNIQPVVRILPTGYHDFSDLGRSLGLVGYICAGADSGYGLVPLYGYVPSHGGLSGPSAYNSDTYGHVPYYHGSTSSNLGTSSVAYNSLR